MSNEAKSFATKPLPRVDEHQLIVLRRRKVIRRWIGNLLTGVVYILIAVVFFTPLLWAVGNSFRPIDEIWSNLVPVSLKTFIPGREFTLRAYRDALGLTVIGRGRGLNMLQASWISLASATTVVAFSLVFNTAAAYFFARLRFPGKNILLLFVIATMMIPQQVVIVPLFLVVNQLGLINTFWALVVPWYSSPFIVFALTQFFAEIPVELDEAAIMDGANLLQILRHVVIPNSIPGLITVSLLEFQFIWNEFYWPLVAVSAKHLTPVQVAIATQFTEIEPDWAKVFAATVIASLPVILLFLAMQRYYYQNVALSGLKG